MIYVSSSDNDIRSFFQLEPKCSIRLDKDISYK